MNLAKNLKRTATGAVAVAMLLAASLGVTSSQVSATPYDPNGTPTSKTPVFNHFTGVPSGVGNEADFVRVKPQAGGNADYVNALNDDCNTGEAYTVRTYVHNGADPAYNTKDGGPAIAHNVAVAMTAPLNAAKSSFEFKSTISASNAASVTDNGFLNCNGKTVKLTLVPSSVKTYSKALGFQGAPDSSVNGSLKIGSQTQGSGDVLACWDDRVTITYDVKVEEVPPQPEPSLGECKVVDLTTESNRKVTVKVNGEVDNAEIVGYRINFGDGTVSEKQTDSHQYAQDGTYVITAEVKVKYADGKEEWKTADNCKKQVTFEGDKPPVVTPPKGEGGPTTLPATGPAGVAAIVTLVTGISTLGYYYVNRRGVQL